MEVTLRIWRQRGPQEGGGLVTYRVEGISPKMSFLETLDVLDPTNDPVQGFTIWRRRQSRS